MFYIFYVLLFLEDQRRVVAKNEYLSELLQDENHSLYKNHLPFLQFL